MKLIILAAGTGSRLSPLTDSMPKVMVPVSGRSILDWQIQVARSVGIQEIIVVRGHMSHQINRPGLQYIDNENYLHSNMVATLWCALDYFDEGFIVSYGDILYQPEVLESLLTGGDEIGVIVDKDWKPYWERRFEDVLDDAESFKVAKEGFITEIGQRTQNIEEIQGQYIGLTVFRANGVKYLVDSLESMFEKPFFSDSSTIKKFDDLYMTDVLQCLITLGHPVKEVPVSGGWVEVDSIKDYEIANEIVENNDGILRINR